MLGLKIVVLLVLIAVNAYFAAAEMALVSLNQNNIRELADKGDKKAVKLLRLLDEPSRFLSTIQIAITLAGYLQGALAAESFAGPLVRMLLTAGFPVHESVLSPVMVVLITIILAYFNLVLGELVPKRVAMKMADRYALSVAGPLSLIAKITSAFVKILTVSTNSVVRLFGIDPNAEDDAVTEKEILMMINEGNERGVIDESQKEMISNIFEFGDLTVADVMTHRTEIGTVEDTASIGDAIALSISKGHSRIPVFHEDIDDIVGVLYVKDLLCLIGSNDISGSRIVDFMRKVLYVPELGRCDDLFKEMSKTKIQMAVVVDEYGGTAGIVTMEDLLEAIVGSIQDEYDDEEEDVVQVSDTTYMISGMADAEETFELLDIELPEDYEFDTMGGFLVELLGRIPAHGETPSVTYQSFTFTVLVVDERRIAQIKAVRQPVTELVDEA